MRLSLRRNARRPSEVYSDRAHQIEDVRAHAACVVLGALWLGLASGLIELAIRAAHWALVGTVTTISVRTNRHFVPMTFITNLLLFGLLGIVTHAASRRLAWLERLLTTFTCWLAVLSPLLSIEELHPWASVVLAAGVAARVAGPFHRHRRMLVRNMLPTTAVGAGAVVAAALLGFAYPMPRHAARSASVAATEDAPNFLLIVLDTVRADHMSLYGYERPTTPRLEELARRGIRFDQARSTASWTLPAHASLFTGRWHHEISVDTDRPLDGRYPTLAEFLTRQGYATAGFAGNLVYCNSWYGLDRGFQHYEDSSENGEFTPLEVARSTALGRHLAWFGARVDLIPTDAAHARRRTAEDVNQAALNWLAGRDRSRPYFAFLNLFDAHGPYLVPKGAPQPYSSRNDQDFRALARRYTRIDRKNPRPEDHAIIEAMSRMGIDAYDDCITYLDTQIGVLLDRMERAGDLRNTWVIITADHGEHFGERGLHRHGNSLYRPLVHIPLLIVPPTEARIPPRVVDEPVSLRAIPASVVDLVDPRLAGAFPGQSLRHVWERDHATSPDSQRDPVLAELRFKAPPKDGDYARDFKGPRFLQSIVGAGHTLIRGGDHGDELYHLTNDPREEANLAETPESAPVLQDLRRRLDRFVPHRAARLDMSRSGTDVR